VAHETYEIGGFRFGVRTTSESFASWVDGLLSQYRVDGEEDAFYSMVVANGNNDPGHRGKRDYHVLYTGFCPVPVLRTLELPTLGYAFLAHLETHLFAARSDLVFVDAVAIPVRDKIAILPRSILPTLTKLGRGARRYGLSLPAETAVAVDSQSGRLAPFDRRVQMAPNALRALEDLGSTGQVRDLFVLRKPVQVDFIFKWDVRGGAAFEPLGRAETLHHLAENAFNLEKMGGRVLTGLGRLVENADCYGLGPMPPARLAEGLVGLS
jgi:hypothetical protein